VARFGKRFSAGITITSGIGGASPRQRSAVMFLVVCCFLSGTRQ